MKLENVKFETIDEYVKYIQNLADTHPDKDHMEIERKWIANKSILQYLRQQSNYKLNRHLTAVVAYLSIDPEIRYIAIKHMKSGEMEYRLDYKNSGELSRKEVMFNIDFKDTLKISSLIRTMVNEKNPSCKTPFMEKSYWSYNLDDSHVLEVNLHDNDRNHVILEVEFDSEEDAMKYRLPQDIMQYVEGDVTYNAKYKTKNYWESTRLRQRKKHR